MFVIIVNFEAPTPNAALLMLFGTNLRASSVVLIIVGSIKIDSDIPPAIPLNIDPNNILVETISENNELIGRSYHFAPEIDGNVILSIKDKNDLKNYIGKFVEANICFADEYDLYGETI